MVRKAGLAVVRKAGLFAAGMIAGIFASHFRPPDLTEIEASIIVFFAVAVIWLIAYFATGGTLDE